jgi:hypothetical protein
MNIEDKKEKYKSLIETKYKSLKEEVGEDKSLSFYKILGISYKENYHSKFIAFLLNPEKDQEEKHGCGSAFLDLFIKMLNEKICNDYDKLSSSNYCKAISEIGSEIDWVNVSGGRVDICICNNDKGKKIIIENKINALDQCAQLLRIYNTYPKSTIIYLTLFGDKASPYSLNYQDKKLEEKYYIKISYKDDIKNWLNDCLKYLQNNCMLNKISKNKLSVLLNDYITVVKRITEVARINDTILPMLAENIQFFFDTFDQARELKKKNVELTCFQKLCLNKVVPLKEYLIKKYFTNNTNNILDNLLKIIGDSDLLWKPNEGRSIMQKGWGFQFYKPEWEAYNIKIGFVFMRENLEDCHYGLRKYNLNNDYIPDCYSNKFKDKKTKFTWYQLDKMQEKYTNWRRGVFFELMSDDIENTNFYKTIKDIVCIMCKKINKEIINLKT